jgi:uncharacterized protein YecE (DUF72 family)
MPGGSQQLTYRRLHGSPRVYYSAYSEEFIDGLASQFVHALSPTWCIFDNTASGAGASDALALLAALRVAGQQAVSPRVSRAPARSPS